MGKCYTVICDSNNYVSQNTIRQTTYFMDWSKLPEGEYNVSFSFLSNRSISQIATIMGLHADFNGSENVSLANNGVSSTSTNFLGFIRTEHGDTAIRTYHATTTDNVKIRLRRPNNNFFTVFLRNDVSTVLYSGDLPTNYVASILFEEIDY